MPAPLILNNPALTSLNIGLHPTTTPTTAGAVPVVLATATTKSAVCEKSVGVLEGVCSGKSVLRNSLFRLAQPQSRVPVITSEKKHNLDLSLQRGTDRAKSNLFFQHGKIASDHPAQIYLNQLAQRLPVKDGAKANFIILPDWMNKNACAFHDGTIFVSFGLLKDVDSEEALLGVLAHEYVHFWREHIQKGIELKDKSSKSKQNYKTSFTKSVSSARTQEWEADLRGAIEILEEMGVSPLPYAKLLEKWHENKESIDIILNRSRATSYEHGSGMDRALNIQSVTHFLDLKGLDNLSVTALPDFVKGDFKKSRAVKSFKIIHRPPYELLTRAESVKERKEERLNLIDQLNAEELVFAIGVMRGQYEKSKTSTDSFDNKMDAVALTKAYAKLKDLIYPDVADIKEVKKNLKALVILFSNNKLTLSDLGESPIEVLSYLEQILVDAEKIPNLMNQNESISNFTTLIVSILITNQNFNGDGDGLIKFVDNLATWFEKFSSKYDVEPKQKNDFLELLMHQDKNLYHAFFPQNIKRVIKLDYAPLIKQVPKKHSRKDIKDSSLGADFLKQLGPDVTPKLILDALNSFSIVLSDEDDIRFVQMEYAILVIYQYCIDHAPCFKNLSNEEKNYLYFYQALSLDFVVNKNTEDREVLESDRFETKNPDQYEMHKASTYENQMERDSAEAEYEDGLKNWYKARAVDESRLYEVKADSNRVVFLYRLLKDHEFRDTYSLFAPLTTITDGVVEARLVTYIVDFLANKNINEVINLFDAWKAEGYDVEKLIFSYPDVASRVKMVLTRAINEDDLAGFSQRDFLRLSKWISNPILRARFQQRYIAPHWHELDFDTKLDFSFSIQGQLQIDDSKLKETFLEEDIQNQEEYKKTKERLGDKVETISTEGSEAGGYALLADNHTNPIYTDTIRFIEILLGTSISDHELKKYVYEIIKDNSAAGESKGSRDLEISERIVNALLHLDDLSKKGLLRKLLVSEGGALKYGKKIQFLEMLFNKWIQQDSKSDDINQILTQIKIALSHLKEWKLLYFSLQGMLSKEIANYPASSGITDWQELTTAQDSQSRAKKSKKLHLPKNANNEPWLYTAKFDDEAERQLYKVLGDKPADTNQKMSPLRFVKETASHMGSLGVRFLQLLPLITDLKPEYEAEFSTVYDQVKGQMKLSALHLLEREWPRFWQDIQSVSERVGGGSIMTVYRAQKSQGGSVIIKVRNPNIEHHLAEVYKYACDVIDQLINQNPEQEVYRSARVLLDDIYQWIQDDISFTDFLTKDRDFKKWSDEQNLESGKYKIYVPESYEPSNPHFAVEEDVPATNLTQWQSLVDAGHDMKAITHLAIKYFVAQLTNLQEASDGSKNSFARILADVHSGNMGIDSQNRLVIYDRNNFIELSVQEQEIITGFIFGLDDKNDLKTKLTEYLGASALESKGASPIVELLVEALTSQDWKMAQRYFVDLKRAGIKIPVKITLLIKNIQALQKMALKAGFTTLKDALFYEA